MKAKRFAAGFAACLVMTFALPAPISAETATDFSGACGENLTWTYDTDTATLTIDGSGETDSWTSPYFGYDGYYQDEFPQPFSARPWADFAESVEHVILSEGVTKIGASAFCGFTALTDAVIPESVTEIEQYAFADCFSLTEAVLPEATEMIGYRAFFQCSSLSRITIPNRTCTIFGGDETICHSYGYASGMTFFDGTICGYADSTADQFASYYHYPFEALDESACGDSLTWAFDAETGTLTISGSGAMYDMTYQKGYQPFTDIPWRAHFNDIQRIVLSDGVTAVGAHALGHCPNLTAVILPETVTEIGSDAFADDKRMETVTLPSSVSTLGERAFSDAGITEIALPNSITEIPEGLFAGCRSLTAVSVPESVRVIGEWAFDKCDALPEIVLPDSVTEIGTGAFYDCTALASVRLSANLTCIAEKTFSGCSSLTDLVIPERVTCIGEKAFEQCKSLQSVILPRTVTAMEMYAFYGCTALTELRILNPDCVIADAATTVTGGYSNDFAGTIYGYADSTAQDYAERYAREFALLGDPAIGDPDNDGKVTAADAQFVLRVYLESGLIGFGTVLTDAQTAAADVDGNGIINSSDAQLILRYYVQESILHAAVSWEQLLETVA